MGTAKKADIKITGASTLATEDVERMVKEAEKFAEEDKKKREAIDTKNQGDSLVYQTRKQLVEFNEKIPIDLKENVKRMQDKKILNRFKSKISANVLKTSINKDYTNS